MALTFRDPDDYFFVRRIFLNNKDNESQDEAIEEYSPKGIDAVNEALKSYLTIPIDSPTETHYGAMCAFILQLMFSEKGDVDNAKLWQSTFDRLIALAIEAAKAEPTTRASPARMRVASISGKLITEEPTDDSYEF